MLSKLQLLQFFFFLLKHQYIITSKIIIQGDQKVYVHLMMYCDHQAHRDLLIALYLLKYTKTNTCTLMAYIYIQGQH